jgi:hypothetical protein
MNGKMVNISQSFVPKQADGSILTYDSTYQAIGGLSAQLTTQPQSTAGSALATAFDLGEMDGGGQYQGTLLSGVSELDSHFFKFKTKANQISTITVELLKNGTPSNDFVVFKQIGTNPQSGIPVLAAVPPDALGNLGEGIYFLNVQRMPGVTIAVNYNLRLRGGSAK